MESLRRTNQATARCHGLQPLQTAGPAAHLAPLRPAPGPVLAPGRLGGFADQALHPRDRHLAAISWHELKDTTVGSRRREEAENVATRSIRLLTSAATILAVKCRLAFNWPDEPQRRRHRPGVQSASRRGRGPGRRAGAESPAGQA